MPTKLQELFQAANDYCIQEFDSVMRGGVTDAWDINNGSCEEWAEYVRERLPGAEVYWLDQLARTTLTHCVVIFEDKFYDAECHDGVSNWKDLPVYKDRRKTREQVIAARTAGEKRKI